jgi:hypothetical protein
MPPVTSLNSMRRSATLLSAAGHPITHVSVGAAVTGVAVALVIGWCGRGWLISENDVQGAKARLAGAKRVMWSSRLAIAGAVVFVWAMALAWIIGQGR